MYKQFKHWKNHKIGFELTYLAINKEGWLKNNKYKNKMIHFRMINFMIEHLKIREIRNYKFSNQKNIKRINKIKMKCLQLKTFGNFKNN